MKSYLAFVVLAASLSSFWSSTVALQVPQEGREPEEKRVRMREVPPAVQKTMREQSRGATIRGITREIENGMTNYEIELRVDGHNKDVLIDPTGAIVVVEEQVTLESLPAAVKATILKSAANGRLGMIESITERDTLVAYEAHIRRSGKTEEIKVSPTGELIPLD